MFNELGRTPEQREPDRRSDEQKQLDQHFPAAKPEEFLTRYGGPGEDVVMTPELKQFDTTARAWMSGAGLPREFGNSLVNAIAKTAQHTKDMTPDQLERKVWLCRVCEVGTSLRGDLGGEAAISRRDDS